MTELYEGELYVAPGKTPRVLQVVRRGRDLFLVELLPCSSPMTPEQVQDRYGWASPVWRYASLERETGPPPEVPVQAVPPWHRVVEAMRRRLGGAA